VRMCAVDERGVIEQVRVDEDRRRHGVGTVLVTAALARGPGYAWSTTELENTAAARVLGGVPARRTAADRRAGLLLPHARGKRPRGLGHV
jgi:GNAT superfamily N-acetyltransferase